MCAIFNLVNKRGGDELIRRAIGFLQQGVTLIWELEKNIFFLSGNYYPEEVSDIFISKDSRKAWTSLYSFGPEIIPQTERCPFLG